MANLSISYRVNRVSTHQVKASVQLGDEIVTATIDELEVELSEPQPPTHGTLVLRFRGKQTALAQSAYVEGQRVSVLVPIADAA